MSDHDILQMIYTDPEGPGWAVNKIESLENDKRELVEALEKMIVLADYASEKELQGIKDAEALLQRHKEES